MTSLLTLRNDHLALTLDADTGALTDLRAPWLNQPLLTHLAPHYRIPEGQSWRTTSLIKRDHRVDVTLLSPHLEATLTYDLTPAPLLAVSVSLRGIGETASLAEPAFPLIRFADDFLSVIEGDERHLFFDGAELGAGIELPCWRVFFRPGHDTGVLFATRSRIMMSHAQIWPREERALEMRPHILCAYSSDYNLFNQPLPIAKGKRYQVDFLIGPWRAADHQSILAATGLDQPFQVSKPSKPRRSRPAPAGIVHFAADLVQPHDTAADHQPGKWIVTTEAATVSPKALFANPGAMPPLLTITPNLAGPHRVYVGIGSAFAAQLRVDNEQHPRLRYSAANLPWFLPFRAHLGARTTPREVDFGVIDLTGRTLRFGPGPSSMIAGMLDYIRFEPLSPAAAKRWQRQQSKPPRIPLTGFADIYDIGYLWGDIENPDLTPYRAVIHAHKAAGFARIHWRIDGECTDFPTKTGTMRPISCWAHNAYEPHSKAYSLTLHRHDMLRAAVVAARESNIELYGWMRFNAYFSGVKSDFFRNHPHMHDHGERGNPLSFKLCLAFPEARKHKIDILVEAASYGLAGLSLGFLRHPPILNYHPVMTQACEQQFGKPPPRNLIPDYFQHLSVLPEDDAEHLQWYRFRAQYMTAFGRELRAALAAAGLAHVKISIWVRPRHCLFDGIDLDAWLPEKLCDEIIAGPFFGDQSLLQPDPAWRQRVQSAVPLLAGIDIAPRQQATRLLHRLAAEHYDGICTYESNDAVCDPRMIDAYNTLRT